MSIGDVETWMEMHFEKDPQETRNRRGIESDSVDSHP